MRLKQSIFVLVAMLLCAFSANAQESVVAKIGNVEYTTFASAMADANAATGDVTVEVYGAVEFIDGMELNGSYTAITFTGMSAEAKITINQTAGGDYLTAHGKTVAFNDLILAKANPAWSGNSGHMGNYFSIQGGTVTYTNCTFPNGACTSTGTAVYNNCTFQNASEYGLWVYDDALVTVTGGTIDSKKGIKVYSEGEESVTSTLTVQNATFTENVTAKPAVAVGYAQSITLIGNTYNNPTGHVELDSGSDADCEGIAFVAEDSEGNDISSELTVVDRSKSSAACGVLVDGKIYTTVTTAAAEATSGSTVTLLYNTTETVELPEGVTLDRNGYTADNVTVEVSLAGEGTEASPYLISSVADLETLRNKVNAGNSYAGQFVKLAADLTLTEAWTPIGNGTRSSKSYSGNAFKGTFNGDNKTIIGLKITSTTGNDAAIGLFGVVDGGTVKNLTLNNVDINVANSNLAGGAIGLMLGGATAENITVNGAIVGNDGVGGIVGRLVVNGTIKDCTNNASVTSSYGGIGGIVGKAYYEDGANTTIFASIDNCTNNGTVTAPMYVGGIVGLARANVTDCVNNGAVVGGTQTGGIIGQLIAAGTVSGNENKAKITGKNHMGGIIGDYTQSNAYTYYNVAITSNINRGELAATEQCAAIMGCNNIDGFTAMTASGNVSYYFVDGLELFGNPEDMVIDDTNKFISPAVAKIGDVEYETLAEAVAAVEDGGTITMIANETFTENNRYNNGGWWDGLGYSGDKSFTIDLNNFTISQDGALNDYLMWFKNDGAKDNTITLKNGTLDAGTTAYCALATASSNAKEITVNLENISLINNNSDGSTVKVRGGAVLNVKDGTVITGKDSYLGIECWAATLNIYDGAKIYMNGTSSYNGCLAGVSGNGTINVYGGEGLGKSGGFIAMTSGGTINIEGGEWIANTDGTYANSNKSVLVAQSDKQYNAGAGNSIVNVTGGTFKGGYNCYGNAAGDAQINISGGNFNADPATYLAQNYVAVENNGVWNVELAVAKIGETAYATLEEAFADAAEGETITLLADATPALTSQRAITKAAVIDLGGNTLTLTEDDLYFGTTTFKNGTIVVDPSVKPSTAVFWMFANQTLTFDAVKVVATGVTGTYLIGLDGNNSDLNLLNGSEILIENTTALDLDVICVNASTGNDIVVENSKVNVTNLDGRVFFRGNYTVKDSEVSLAGITKAGFRIEAGQTLSIEGTSTVTIEGVLRDGGIHITDATATYTKAETATVNATVNAPAPAYVAKIGEQGYATLSAAFAAVTDDAQTVVVLQDVTEELTGANLRGNITTENGAKVTINLTNSDWVYCPYTFVLGENITLNVPALFYYAGGAQINGAVITDAYYQRYAGTKLTINEPGSLTVTGETFIIRYTDNDANAGIYVNGDNNDETVGLNLSVAYFYQGMIYAKDANIKTSVYWQTNETDGQGSANLVLDNSTLNVTVNEHNFKATGNSTVTLTNGSSIVIAGAFETGSNTEVSVDATSSIIDKNGKVQFGLSGEGTEANPFLISSVDDLVLFRNSVNAGETKYSAPGIYVALGADIDLAGENWTPIGNITYNSQYKPEDASKVFSGVFNGNGKVISNLKVASTVGGADTQANVGLFGITGEGAVIKDLTLTNVNIETDGRNVGAIAGFAYKATLKNITVNGNIQIKGGNNVAGIAGMTRYYAMSATDITVSGADGSAIVGNNIVGGIFAEIAPNGSVQEFTGLNIENVAVTGVGGVGGIVGLLTTGAVENVSVKNVVLTGRTDYQGNAMGRIRLGSVAGLMGGKYATIANETVENVTAKNLDGNAVELPVIGANYDAASNATEAKIGNTYYNTLLTALDAAKENETVTLIADVEATEALNINCALDLNGHSLTATVAPTALPEGYAALPNLDGKFVIGAQPTATVNDLGMTTVKAGEYSIYNGNSFDQNTEDDGDMPLSFVMQFLADQDAEDMATSPYAEWYGDFVITFTGIENGSFTANGCYLAGHYGSWGWVKVPVDGMVIEEGVRYPVMLGVGLPVDYQYICSSVEDFKCALYLTPEILAANPNIKVNLELGIVDSSKEIVDARDALINNENVYSVTDYTYDAEDFVVDPNYIAVFTINDAEMVDYVNDTEKTVGTLTYNRTLIEGIWNPLYLPFQIPVDELIDNYDIAYYNQMLSSDSDNDGAFDSYIMEVAYITSGTLRENYPYFIRPKTSEDCDLEYVANDVTLYAAEEIVIRTSSVANIFKLHGTHKTVSAADLAGCYTIKASGSWIQTEIDLRPHRLYLEILENDNSPFAPAVAKSIRIVVSGEDGTTGVDEIRGENGDDMIFDLQGRRVLEPQKGGLYIINGKKVLY